MERIRPRHRKLHPLLGTLAISSLAQARTIYCRHSVDTVTLCHAGRSCLLWLRLHLMREGDREMEMAHQPHCVESTRTWVRSGQSIQFFGRASDRALDALPIPGFHLIYVDETVGDLTVVADILRDEPLGVLASMVYVPQDPACDVGGALVRADQIGLPTLVRGLPPQDLVGPRVAPFAAAGEVGAALVAPARHLVNRAYHRHRSEGVAALDLRDAPPAELFRRQVGVLREEQMWPTPSARATYLAALLGGSASSSAPTVRQHLVDLDSVQLVVREVVTAGRRVLLLVTDEEWAEIAGQELSPPGRGTMVAVHAAEGDDVRVPVRHADGTDGVADLSVTDLATALTRLAPDALSWVLVSCGAGSISGGLAARLADLTNLDVLAPQGDVRIGAVISGGISTRQGESWQLFLPQDEIGGEGWDVMNDLHPGGRRFDGVGASHDETNSGLRMGLSPFRHRQGFKVTALHRHKDKVEEFDVSQLECFRITGKGDQVLDGAVYVTNDVDDGEFWRRAVTVESALQSGLPLHDVTRFGVQHGARFYGLPSPWGENEIYVISAHGDGSDAYVKIRTGGSKNQTVRISGAMMANITRRDPNFRDAYRRGVRVLLLESCRNGLTFAEELYSELRRKGYEVAVYAPTTRLMIADLEDERARALNIADGGIWTVQSQEMPRSWQAMTIADLAQKAIALHPASVELPPVESGPLSVRSVADRPALEAIVAWTLYSSYAERRKTLMVDGISNELSRWNLAEGLIIYRAVLALLLTNRATWPDFVSFSESYSKNALVSILLIGERFERAGSANIVSDWENSPRVLVPVRPRRNPPVPADYNATSTNSEELFKSPLWPDETRSFDVAIKRIETSKSLQRAASRIIPDLLREELRTVVTITGTIGATTSQGQVRKLLIDELRRVYCEVLGGSRSDFDRKWINNLSFMTGPTRLPRSEIILHVPAASPRRLPTPSHVRQLPPDGMSLPAAFLFAAPHVVASELYSNETRARSPRLGRLPDRPNANAAVLWSERAVHEPFVTDWPRRLAARFAIFAQKPENSAALANILRGSVRAQNVAGGAEAYRVSPQDVVDLVTAVHSWGDSWDGEFGQVFADVIAYILKVRIHIHDGSPEGRLIAPLGEWKVSEPISLWHAGGNHYNVWTPPDASQSIGGDQSGRNRLRLPERRRPVPDQGQPDSLTSSLPPPCSEPLLVPDFLAAPEISPTSSPHVGAVGRSRSNLRGPSISGVLRDSAAPTPAAPPPATSSSRTGGPQIYRPPAQSGSSLGPTRWGEIDPPTGPLVELPKLAVRYLPDSCPGLCILGPGQEAMAEAARAFRAGANEYPVFVHGSSLGPVVDGKSISMTQIRDLIVHDSRSVGRDIVAVICDLATVGSTSTLFDTFAAQLFALLPDATKRLLAPDGVVQLSPHDPTEVVVSATILGDDGRLRLVSGGFVEYIDAPGTARISGLRTPMVLQHAPRLTLARTGPGVALSDTHGQPLVGTDAPAASSLIALGLPDPSHTRRVLDAALTNRAGVTEPTVATTWPWRIPGSVIEHPHMHVIASPGSAPPQPMVAELLAAADAEHPVILIGAPRASARATRDDVAALNLLLEQYAQRGQLPTVVSRGIVTEDLDVVAARYGAVVFQPAMPVSRDPVDRRGLSIELWWEAKSPHQQKSTRHGPWQRINRDVLDTAAALAEPTAAVSRISAVLGDLIWAPDYDRARSAFHAVERRWGGAEMKTGQVQVEQMLGRVPGHSLLDGSGPALGIFAPVLEFGALGHADIVFDYVSSPQASRPRQLLSSVARLERAGQLDAPLDGGLSTTALASMVKTAGATDISAAILNLIGDIKADRFDSAADFIARNRHTLTVDQRGQWVEAIRDLTQAMPGHVEHMKSLAEAVYECGPTLD
ncbi:OTU domain-containing protein [Micromonospora sp. NPDC049102]|uniref:OTU domain-containing protein n=1 Tax=Micromonospora sp. NPDC049102 TaxID=3364265 RepID=UPI0037113EEC